MVKSELTTKETVKDQAVQVEEVNPDEVFTGAEEVELDDSDRLTGTGGVGTRFFAIAQSQGANIEKVENAGKFFTKNDDGNLEFYDSLDVVILESQPRRTRFEDDHVACKSYGGLTGSDGQECKACKYNPFKENEIPEKDRCKNSYVVLCVPADDIHAEPFFLQIGASGIRDFKDYAAMLQNKYKRPVFSAVTKISVIRRKNNHNSLTFVPVFKPVKALSADETANLRNIRIVESHRFKPVDESTPTGAAIAKAEAEAVASDRDPFEDE